VWSELHTLYKRHWTGPTRAQHNSRCRHGMLYPLEDMLHLDCNAKITRGNHQLFLPTCPGVPTVFNLLAALERTIAKPPTIGGLTCTLAWSSWHLAPLLLNHLAPGFHSVPVVVPPQSSSDKIRVTAEGRQPRNVSKQ
jgi:hypothetical protein